MTASWIKVIFSHEGAARLGKGKIALVASAKKNCRMNVIIISLRYAYPLFSCVALDKQDPLRHTSSLLNPCSFNVYVYIFAINNYI